MKIENYEGAMSCSAASRHCSMMLSKIAVVTVEEIDDRFRRIAAIVAGCADGLALSQRRRWPAMAQTLQNNIAAIYPMVPRRSMFAAVSQLAPIKLPTPMPIP